MVTVKMVSLKTHLLNLAVSQVTCRRMKSAQDTDEPTAFNKLIIMSLCLVVLSYFEGTNYCTSCLALIRYV